ncbi:MAG TPA: ATP-binding protein [Pyrinomonadaceae bacterium]|nr:ATP-binding protein [Pyrinomonadaceae bacterium]
MKRSSDLKVVLFFVFLTMVMTVLVIIFWEKTLRPPFFAWVDARYPGEAQAERRWNIKQRTEHVFISLMVDALVVTLLLRVVRRQQQQLLASEARYRALFEQAQDGIGVVRAKDYRLLEANGKFCDILGCRVEEVVGRDVRELLRTKDDEDARPNHPSVAPLEQPPGECELNVETGQGRTLPVSISSTPLATDGEEITLIVIRDLSARKQFEAEREEMQRQFYQSSKLASIGELSAGVAHEINNPLNGVINFAQLLKDEERPRTEFERQMIDGIIDEGGRIAQIVRGLLAFARADTHELEHVHVAEPISTSIALFARQLEKDGIRVEVELEPNLPAVRADGSRLRQVVVNIISNAHYALKAKTFDVPEPKVFRITARRAEKEGAGVVRMEFFDNGVGIRSEDLGKVFDPFFTTRRDAKGTGLGLSISFGIIRDYGGTISVESEEGRFTRFVVDLPSIEAWEDEYA